MKNKLIEIFKKALIENCPYRDISPDCKVSCFGEECYFIKAIIEKVKTNCKTL